MSQGHAQVRFAAPWFLNSLPANLIGTLFSNDLFIEVFVENVKFQLVLSVIEQFENY